MIAGFESFEPHGPWADFRKTVYPVKKCAQASRPVFASAAPVPIPAPARASTQTPGGAGAGLLCFGARCVQNFRSPGSQRFCSAAEMASTLPSMASAWRQDLMYQIPFVPQANREILNQIDGIGGLPFVFVLIGAPLDETGPAGQSARDAGQNSSARPWHRMPSMPRLSRSESSASAGRRDSFFSAVS